MVELCACGHELDHRDRPCRKPVELPDAVTGICPCPSGVRVDLATFQVMADVNSGVQRANVALMRILAIMETATQLQSHIVDDGKGGKRIDVQPRQATPQIVIPR